MKWKIFYDDGSTFCDLDGSPYDAPARGVQVIAQEDEYVGRLMQIKCDYYWWTDKDGWMAGDLFGLYDYLSISGYRKVIFGRMINYHQFRELYLKAESDSYLPPKSAFHHTERRV